MELKCPARSHLELVEVRFNRTFMELKFADDPEEDARAVGFNRTFMELKLATGSAANLRLLSF